MMKRHLFFSALLAASLCLPSAASAASAALKTVTVTKKPLSQSLYYSGIIKPLNTMAVTTSAAGTVEKLYFQYGQPVKKGQLLFEVDSNKFQSDLVTAIKTYLTSKSSLNQSKSKLTSSESLWKYGLISRDDYTSAKNTFYTDSLAFLQAKQALEALLQKHHDIKIDYQSLSLEDIDRIKKLLSSEGESEIKAYAPMSGIALIPSANANQGLGQMGGAAPSGPVESGSAVQENQALLSVGDLSGATIDISVNEVNVNQITPGLKATVTSMAFPDVTLKGKVISVGSQAKSGGGGIPTFPVVVSIPVLTRAEQKLVRVGMSAKVELDIIEKPQLQIPIDAVIEKGNGNFVKVKTASGIKLVPVTTGATSVDTVVVRSGLKAGDTVVLPH